MRNYNAFFIAFCLCLTVGLVSAYAVFMGHFNGRDVYEIKLAQFGHEMDQIKFANSLLSHQIKDFQQSVAQILPNEKKLQAKYEIQNLSAVVRRPANEEALDLSGIHYERAKKYFAEQDYDKAIEAFYKLVEQYPLSIHVVEAHFFIAESYYLKKDFRNSLSVIDKMVNHFPQNKLTGFILLRMGQMSEFNNQMKEASEIYRVVKQNFTDETLLKQAKNLAENVAVK